jgi:hypothetical protein
MSEPTIEQRLRRRYLLLSTDGGFVADCQSLTPPGWDQVKVDDLDQAGEWHELLLFRFLVLDLDECDVFDPMDVIREIRNQHQINLAVFCFGGDDDIRDEMRLARADRFFAKNEVGRVLPMFFEQYAWGG